MRDSAEAGGLSLRLDRGPVRAPGRLAGHDGRRVRCAAAGRAAEAFARRDLRPRGRAGLLEHRDRERVREALRPAAPQPRAGPGGPAGGWALRAARVPRPPAGQGPRVADPGRMRAAPGRARRLFPHRGDGRRHRRRAKGPGPRRDHAVRRLVREFPGAVVRIPLPRPPERAGARLHLRAGGRGSLVSGPPAGRSPLDLDRVRAFQGVLRGRAAAPRRSSSSTCAPRAAASAG